MGLYAAILSLFIFVILLYMSVTIFTGRAIVNTEKSILDKIMVIFLLSGYVLTHGKAAFGFFSGLFETGFEGVVFNAISCVSLLIGMIPCFIVLNKWRHKVNSTVKSGSVEKQQ